MSGPLLKNLRLSQLRSHYKMGIVGHTMGKVGKQTPAQFAGSLAMECNLTAQKLQNTRKKLVDLRDYAGGVLSWLERQDVSREFVEEFKQAIEKARECE